MTTISENLLSLNEAKVAIKTALENKGKSLVGVPFTQYSEKIDELDTSGSLVKSDIIKQLVDLRGHAKYLFSNFARYNDDALDEMLRSDVTENATDFTEMFNSADVVTIPSFDISKTTSLQSLFRMATRLENAPMLDTKHIQNFNNVCNQCTALQTIPAWDVRNGTNFSSAFSQSFKLQEIWFKNIKANIQVASGTTWGHLLTVDSLIHLIRELRDTGALLTLTVGSANLEKLANIYVRLVEITDEMRAEDDLIDEKLPFEVCESTEEGAMLITNYPALKNWSLA